MNKTFFRSLMIVVSLSLVLLFVGIGFLEKDLPLTTKTYNNNQQVTVELLSGVVSPGLNKIQINDSTTILIYRGTESCTMIQLK